MKRVLLAFALLSAVAAAQVVTAPMPDGMHQFFDANGPLSGGKVYSYIAGTSTPLATYTDSTGATKNTNPITLDSAGRASIWLGPYSYKIVVKSAAGVTQWTQDNLAVYSFSTITTSPAWGGISGTLSNQGDLQTALDAKATISGTPVTNNCVKWASATTIADAGVTCGGGGGGGMVYPGAGVPKSTGAAWDTSYTVGTAASNLVQLNGSAQLPAVSGANLTNLNATNLSTGTVAIARLPDLSSTYTVTSRTINGHALTSDVTVTAADVGKTVAQWNANQFQGRTFASTAPSAGQVIRWSGSQWEPYTLASSVSSTQTDATASRAIDGTVYTNGTGKLMMVNVIIGGGTTSSCYTDANADPSLVVCGGGGSVTHTFFVLPGNKYKVSSDGTLSKWIEWTLG